MSLSCDENHEIVWVIFLCEKCSCDDSNRLIVNFLTYIRSCFFQPEENLKQMPPTNFDMDKVKTTLKQFVRDWSASGEQERRECYDPVLSEVKEIFKDRYTS